MGYRIGIQILSYNKPKYLVQTLDSLVKVRGPNDKIIVFEQSNTHELRQEGLAICKEYSDVQVILSTENLGQRGATNKIIQSGFYNDCDFVMLTDHDNLFHETLDLCVDKLNEDRSIWVTTFYNSPEHDIEDKSGDWLIKSTARAGHMVFRQKDFMSMTPIDEQAGLSNGCAWFCGLDWWLTHWSVNSPGLKRPRIVAAYPGGCSHIGVESTWQGKYDDEYTVEENLRFRKSSMEEILTFYKPRHTYQSEKYWYEKIIIESTPVGDDSVIKDLFMRNFNKQLSDSDFTIVKSFWNIHESKPEFKPVIESNSGGIIAFNYIWPNYGFMFLKESIESILPYVDEYILYLNRYSYIGKDCDPKNLEFVKNIIDSINSDKITVYYKDDPDFKNEAKQDNIRYYIKQCLKDRKDRSAYIWLVQSDEVYDFHMAEDVLNLCKNNEIEHVLQTQPICYMDNPHWFVNPPEHFDRPTVIRNSPDVDLNVKNFRTDITFHHLSYVLTNDELKIKFSNWGHRNDVDLPSFLTKFNNLKTNKYLQGLHPIYPNVYQSVAFTDISDMNKKLFKQWINYGLLKSNISEFIINNLIGDGVTLLYNIELPLRLSDKKFVEIGRTESDISNYNDVNSNNVQRYLGTIKSIIPSKFENNYFSLAFINADDLLYQNILEIQPKLKDFGWYAIVYETDDQLNIIKKLIQKAILVNAPWGQETFRFYEIYYDILSDYNDFKLCLARLRKR